MTFLTHLQFGDNATGQYSSDYLVVSYHNNISRVFTAFQPQSLPKDTDIIVTIASPSKEDLRLYEWFVENTCLSGRILFEIMDVKSNAGVIQRSVYFTDAQCISLRDTYDVNRKLRRQLTICFNPARIKVEDVTFTRTGSDDNKPHDDDDKVDMEKYNAQYDF